MKKPVKRKSKYYAPQNEGVHRMCDFPGCEEKGEFRAPKNRSLKDYYWFCLKHVQEYNARWNYYDGMDTEEDVGNEKKRRFRFGAGVKYNFGFDFYGNFDFFDYGAEYSSAENRFSAEEQKSLKVMELKAEGLTIELLKKQYKKLVKKYHPDVNGGDAEAEEKFKQLGNAYKCLLQKLSKI